MGVNTNASQFGNCAIFSVIKSAKYSFKYPLPFLNLWTSTAELSQYTSAETPKVNLGGSYLQSRQISGRTVFLPQTGQVTPSLNRISLKQLLHRLFPKVSTPQISQVKFLGNSLSNNKSNMKIRRQSIIRLNYFFLLVKAIIFSVLPNMTILSCSSKTVSGVGIGIMLLAFFIVSMLIS